MEGNKRRIIDPLHLSDHERKNLLIRFDTRLILFINSQSGFLRNKVFIYGVDHNFLLDYQVAQIVEQRDKSHGKALFVKLMEAFKALSAMNIFNFSIDLGSGGTEDFRKIETTLRHLMRFYADEKGEDWFVVRDEYDQPNINLTLLAATNNVKPPALQSLVNRIKPMILGPNPDKGLDTFTTVYDAIFASMHNRQQLKKMPLEVNNTQWLMQNLRSTPARTAEVVQISRLILAKYGNNPRMASEVITSINSEGYQDIRADVMGKRLTRATDFLSLAEESSNKETLQSEALRNIEEGLDHLPDETYDSISIDGDEFSTINETGQKTKWSLHEKIMGLLSFFKRRSVIKKKVQDIANKKVQFSDDDYAVIAKNFKITKMEAAHLIALLRACFDDRGYFHRNFFERNIPEFVQYGNKVFTFLWHYLKELSLRNDRVTFLNSLQPLVAGLEMPQDALNILLSDIFDRKGRIRYSDRNALILGSLLLRFSDMTARSNIELTPEEVLQIPDSLLNQDMIQVALKYFRNNHEYLIQKFRRAVELLFNSSIKEKYADDEMQPRFILYLIRELVIHLSLIGGNSAKLIMRGVVEEFGNPHSSYYQEMRDKDNLRYSLQLLQVAARGLRRFEDPEGARLLDGVLSNQSVFIELYSNQDHHNLVDRVMEKIRNPEFIAL